MLTIIEEDNVLAVIDQEKLKFSRIDDSYEALKWRIARRPESGSQMVVFK